MKVERRERDISPFRLFGRAKFPSADIGLRVAESRDKTNRDSHGPSTAAVYVSSCSLPAQRRQVGLGWPPTAPDFWIHAGYQQKPPPWLTPVNNLGDLAASTPTQVFESSQQTSKRRRVVLIFSAYWLSSLLALSAFCEGSEFDFVAMEPFSRRRSNGFATNTTKLTVLPFHHHLPPTFPLKNSLHEFFLRSFHLSFSIHLFSSPSKPFSMRNASTMRRHDVSPSRERHFRSPERDFRRIAVRRAGILLGEIQNFPLRGLNINIDSHNQNSIFGRPPGEASSPSEIFLPAARGHVDITKGDTRFGNSRFRVPASESPSSLVFSFFFLSAARCTTLTHHRNNLKSLKSARLKIFFLAARLGWQGLNLPLDIHSDLKFPGASAEGPQTEREMGFSRV
ncbi:hypothetical protein R3P38DRAFT_3360880 [Favolaschia claudopus]|uniref:Uncharacterized protein n=1 Tax=Favolaschia claudopus TaxID=2862362 RepID=A0AAW0AVG4_9AGAR